MKATGPHVFLHYTGRRRVTALIGEVGGRQLHVSAANLLPMRPEQPFPIVSPPDPDDPEDDVSSVRTEDLESEADADD